MFAVPRTPDLVDDLIVPVKLELPRIKMSARPK
jgi:hypothetical protein